MAPLSIDYVDGFAPVAVSPAAAAGFVFFGKILRVVDQDVGAFGELAHGLVEVRVAGFVVGGVDQNAFFGFEAESHASLRMIQPRGFDPGAIGHGQASIVDVVEVELRLDLVEVDGEIRRGHLFGHYLLETTRATGRVEYELAAGVFIQRPEKRHALNVVPVEMRNKNVRGERVLGELAFQFAPQHAESRAAVEDVDLISDAHFHAGGIASVAQILGLWRGRGTAHAPKLDSHKL